MKEDPAVIDLVSTSKLLDVLYINNRLFIYVVCFL